MDVTLELLSPDNAVILSYALPVESLVVEINRNPVVFPIPAAATDRTRPLANRPVAWALDFGMMSETVIASGTLVDGGRLGVAALREIARTHWSTLRPSSRRVGGVYLWSAGGARLVVSEGPGQAPTPQAYQGVITQLRTQRQGGVPRWDYTLSLAVSVWPEGMGRI